jgi:ribosome-associated heat shock protein Hsp15
MQRNGRLGGRFAFRAMEKNPPAPAAVRLDLWLWAARFYKTRSLAKAAVEAGRVTLGGQHLKPARALRIGELLEVTRAGERYAIEVRALSEQRGSAKVAETLYRESDESRTARLAERERRRLEASGYQAPGTKPDKRARRLIRALGDLDAL